MSLERMEEEYQREHADPVRGRIGLGVVVLLISAFVILWFVIPGLIVWHMPYGIGWALGLEIQ